MAKEKQFGIFSVPVTADLERILLALLEEYERGRAIDLAAWVGRFPSYREELIDHWIALQGTDRLDSISPTVEPPRDSVSAAGLQRASEAIALGRAWLEEPVDDEFENLAAALKTLRAQPYQFQGKARKPFRKAAVFAWMALTLAERRAGVSRLAVQKSAYILERGLALDLFTDHRKKPLGPYDHSAKYRDAEPIAEKQGWLTIRGASMEAGPSAQYAIRYAQRYVRSMDLARRIIEIIAPLSDSELETWTTVDWVARNLSSRGERVDVKSVVQSLRRSPEWRPKLDKPGFSELRIQESLRGLTRLGFLDVSI